MNEKLLIMYIEFIKTMIKEDEEFLRLYKNDDNLRGYFTAKVLSQKLFLEMLKEVYE